MKFVGLHVMDHPADNNLIMTVIIKLSYVGWSITCN